MKLFLALSFLVLAVLYWAASGGAGFEPEARPEPEALAEAEPVAPSVAPSPVPQAEAEASQAASGPAPTTPPEGLPASPLDPDAALAALAPDLAGTDPAAPESPEPAATPAGPLREVTGDAVNVRAGPGTGFDVVGQLRRGERAEVVALQDGWASVRAGDVEGWMSERFLAAP